MVLEWTGALERKDMERKVADTLVYAGEGTRGGSEARASADKRYGVTAATD